MSYRSSGFSVEEHELEGVERLDRSAVKPEALRRQRKPGEELVVWNRDGDVPASRNECEWIDEQPADPEGGSQIPWLTKREQGRDRGRSTVVCSLPVECLESTGTRVDAHTGLRTVEYRL